MKMFKHYYRIVEIEPNFYVAEHRKFGFFWCVIRWDLSVRLNFFGFLGKMSYLDEELHPSVDEAMLKIEEHKAYYNYLKLF